MYDTFEQHNTILLYKQQVMCMRDWLLGMQQYVDDVIISV